MPTMSGFMGKAVSRAAVIAALVGGAIVAATGVFTGSVEVGAALILPESSAPTGQADECTLHALNNEKLNAQCGAAGSPTTLVDVNGDMSIPGDLSVIAGSKINVDGPTGDDYIVRSGGDWNFFHNGVKQFWFDENQVAAVTTLTAETSFVGEGGIYLNGGSTRTTTGSAAEKLVTPVNPSGGGFTLTLPAANASGRYVVIKNVTSSTNTVTIAPDSGDAIPECVTSLTIAAAYGWAILWSQDETNWFLVGGASYTCT